MCTAIFMYCAYASCNEVVDIHEDPCGLTEAQGYCYIRETLVVKMENKWCSAHQPKANSG